MKEQTTTTTTTTTTAAALLNSEATNYANAANRIAAWAATSWKTALASHEWEPLEIMTGTAYKRWAMKSAEKCCRHASEANRAGDDATRYNQTRKATMAALDVQAAADALWELIQGKLQADTTDELD